MREIENYQWEHNTVVIDASWIQRRKLRFVGEKRELKQGICSLSNYLFQGIHCVTDGKNKKKLNSRTHPKAVLSQRD